MNRHAQMIRPLWAEIDLGAVRHNVKEVRRLVGDAVEIMAVVKAEAYGHGANEVARAAVAAGATWFGVALPEEGIALRCQGFTQPILVFGALQPDQVETFLAHDLTAAVCTLTSATALSRAAVKAGKTANVHIAVDTGMGRIGVTYTDAVKFTKSLLQLPGIKVSGIFSHFATADHAVKDFAKTQLERFTQIVTRMKAENILPEKVHIANSAAIIDLPSSYFNMVRPGIILYGLTPSDEMELKGKIDLRPALSLKTRVGYVKRVPPQTGISYGLRYQTKKETTIATLPIGYADGWSRRLTNQAEALIHGKRYPIVGTICMDQCMIDVGDDPVEPGDEVILIGKSGEVEISADDIAHKIGTINYEVTCMLSDRIPRVYKS